MEYKNATEYPLKYDRDGTRVRIIEETPNFYLALPETNWGWNARDTQPLPFMPDPEIYDRCRLSDEAPVGRYDSKVKELKRQIAELEEEVKSRRVLANTIKAETESARERYEHIEEACQRHEWINELVDLANGNIQYVIKPSPHNFDILPLADFVGKHGSRTITVVGVLSDERQGIDFNLTCQGSGKLMVFAEDLESALFKAQAIIDEMDEYTINVVQVANESGLALDSKKVATLQSKLTKAHLIDQESREKALRNLINDHKITMNVITKHQLEHGQ